MTLKGYLGSTTVTVNQSTTAVNSSAERMAADINAVKELNPNRNLISCLELHTFSSLDKNFISNFLFFDYNILLEYMKCMNLYIFWT